MSDTVKILCANNAFGSLASALGSTDKTLILSGDQGDKFPYIESGATAFYATLEDADGNLEVILVTSRIQSTLTATRGQCGTMARSWPVGTEISLRVTAELLEDKICRKEFAEKMTDNASARTDLSDQIAVLRKTKLDKTAFESLQEDIQTTYDKYKAEVDAALAKEEKEKEEQEKESESKT